MPRAITLEELNAKFKAVAIAAGYGDSLGGAEAKAQLRALITAKDAAPIAAPHVLQIESIDEANRTVVFVMSDATKDRIGDRLLPDGCRTANFMRNPQFLWMHQMGLPGLGKVLELWIENGQLKGTAWFTPAEIDEPGDPAHSFSERCWSLAKAGILNAVSVSFKTLDAIWNGEGLDVLEWELLECSLVTVGMNPNALVDGKSAAALLEDRMPTKQNSDDSTTGGGSTVTDADLEKRIKGIEGMCAALEKAIEGVNAHASKLAAMHDELRVALDAVGPDEADDSGKKTAATELRAKAEKLWGDAKAVEAKDPAQAAALRREAAELHEKADAEIKAKSGAAKLSSKNFSRLKKAATHIKSVLADHVASDGVPDDEDDDGKGDDAKSFDAWFAGLSPDDLKNLAIESATAEIQRQRGEID